MAAIVKPGEVITAAGWNGLIDEINLKATTIGLNGKVSKTGDTMTGPLTINSNQIVTGSLSFGSQTRQMINLWSAEHGVGVQNSTTYFRADANFGWHKGGVHSDNMLDPGTGGTLLMALNKDGNLGLGTANPTAKLHVNGSLRIGSDTGPLLSLYPNLDSWLRIDGHTGNTAPTPRSGGLVLAPTINTTSLTTPFYVNNSGDGSFSASLTVGTSLYAGTSLYVVASTNVGTLNVRGTSVFNGAKTGYVVDLFINRVDDTLEEGDVVVIGDYEITHYYGMNSNIPVPEVDLTDKAYDTRVCGIVAKMVTESELPLSEASNQAMPLSMPFSTENEEASVTAPAPAIHPFAAMVAKEDTDFNHRIVASGQMGQMATLGAFAHCKVDADIAPIKAGDLLTTSPTKGHAQKVTDTTKAVGAIIGKALAGLASGKGKIPVMVLLQ